MNLSPTKLALIGRSNTFSVTRLTPSGAVLTRDGEEFLLPTRLAQGPVKVGDTVTAFIYTDSEDRPIATMQKPLAQVGQFACLKVIDHNQHGVFLDWGLDKDLFCPRAEQYEVMKLNSMQVVAVYLDNATGRVAAAGRLAQFFEYDVSSLHEDEEVDLLVYALNSRGAQVIVNDLYSGMVFLDQNFKRMDIGDRLKGYVDHIRTDNKLDIRLRPNRTGDTFGKLRDARTVVLDALRSNAGVLSLGDKSSAEAIHDALGISKKAFKAAVGQLYKQGLVHPGEESTQLIQNMIS